MKRKWLGMTLAAALVVALPAAAGITRVDLQVQGMT